MTLPASGQHLRIFASAAVCSVWMWPHVARSQDAANQPSADRPAVSIVAAIDRGSVEQAILVGPSGQLYRPDGSGLWHRQVAGGVAADVRAALSPSPDQVFVAGERSPLYRLTQGRWDALHSTRRGRITAASDGGVPVLVVGRHLHIWRDGAWAAIAQARARVRAVWASSPTRVYVSLANGAMDKWSKGRWIRTPTPSGSLLGDGRFVGRSGKKLFMLADTGAILEVGARRAVAVALAADLSGVLSAHAGAVDSAGDLWIVGTYGPGAGSASADGTDAEPAATRDSDTAAERMVLLHYPADGKGRALSLVEPLPMVDASDVVTVLVRDDAGAMLLCTRGGQVHVRSASGAWSPARIATAVPDKQFRSRSVRPARTR